MQKIKKIQGWLTPQTTSEANKRDQYNIKWNYEIKRFLLIIIFTLIVVH